MTWPPTLVDLKTDLGIDLADTRDDTVLTTELAAAVDEVERVRRGDFQFDPADSTQWSLPAPTDDIKLGTLRMAGRLQARRRSPDGVIDMGDLGASRVPAYDNDIERLLGVGKYRKPFSA